jgi:hypothetical protein
MCWGLCEDTGDIFQNFSLERETERKADYIHFCKLEFTELSDELLTFFYQVHVGIGMEGVSVSSTDLLALATIQTLLGGGDSFSAGGPGKV